MNLLQALETCKKQNNYQSGYYARPVAWKGSGEAVDLSGLAGTTNLRIVLPIHPTAAFLRFWQPTLLDLEGEWEVISAEDLTREANQGSRESFYPQDRGLVQNFRRAVL